MEDFTIQELKRIINDGDFGLFVGKMENSFFDCKTGTYDLTKDSKKRELAKDVSSFANLNGGYILIGLQTPQEEKDKSKTHFGDEIIKISLFDQNLVNPSQYLEIIESWVYPREIKGLNIYWKASKDNSSKGIIIIEIPTQIESSKPFLINKIVEESGKISEVVFGYAERKGDKSDPKKIGDIQKIMRDGLLYDKNIENRFAEIEALVQILIRKKEKEDQGENNTKIINERINKIMQSYDEQ